MLIQLQPSNRQCQAERVGRFSTRKIKRDILAGREVQDGFTQMSTPAPCTEQTVFKVYRNQRELMIAVALFETTTPNSLKGRPEFSGELEILFDPYHDHAGFCQFLFPRDGEVWLNHHLPYPESHSTAFRQVELKGYQWEAGEGRGPHWLFARFHLDGVFRNGERCGFNMARSSVLLRETTSWNHCSGNGVPDATSFGHLYSDEGPRGIELSSATIANGAMTVSGAPLTDAARFSFELADPQGRSQEIPVKSRQSGWQARAKLTRRTRGRYRLYVREQGGEVEPDYYFFDLPGSRRDSQFSLCMTYDIPDNLTHNFYTPDRLRNEMAKLAGWGIEKLYWLDYTGFPTFWQWLRWKTTSAQTVRHGGDVLKLAVDTAHGLGLEFIGLLKPFDIGFNSPEFLKGSQSKLLDLERKPVSAVPEIESHQEWTMQANPAWSVPVSYPVTSLEFFSRRPLKELSAGDVRLWVSADNSKYRRYRKPFSLKQGEASRPHYRWTPDGKSPEKGRVKNWFIELGGLKLDQPFVAIEVRGPDIRLVNQAFVFAESCDSAGADVPLTVSTSGDLDEGFEFWREWPSWNNRTERILEDYVWDGRPIGIALEKMPNLPTLLEPSFEGARQIWLGRLRTLLQAGADGVGVRTLCHHNACLEWLPYAFADPVRRAFQDRHGREPECREGDYEEVRRIRGDYYTQFLRDAKALTSSYGKKLAVHFEMGIDVPPHLDTRMQLHLDWERWLDEGIMDEIYLKFWSAQSPFIHEKVLPAARRRGIPVTICDRNGFLHANRGIELAERLVREAYEAGYSGYTFYEAADYIQLNPEGVPTPVGHAEAAIRKASDTLATLTERGQQP